MYIRLAFYLEVGAEDATIMSLLQNAGRLSIRNYRFIDIGFIFMFSLKVEFFFWFANNCGRSAHIVRRENVIIVNVYFIEYF